MEGYDNQSGMWMKPPVISHDDTVTDRSEIDDSIYKAYVDQADSFYDVLQEALGAEEMTKLLSSFPCGMHSSETAVCYEQDGPTCKQYIMLLYISKFGCFAWPQGPILHGSFTHDIIAMFTVTPPSNDLPLGLLNASRFQLMRW